jgi:RNA polymerase sigma factor (TIGR02999 family)
VSDATRILERAQAGDPHAADQLLPLVYDELRKLAAHKLAQEAPGQTLQPTALVHEAWLRLVGSGEEYWGNRAHFFAAAAEAMRRILIDRARSKSSARHGGQQKRVELDRVRVAMEDTDEVVLAMHEALDRLAAVHPVKAEVVKLRYFVGMNHGQVAQALGFSEATVRRHWTYARAWLYADMKTHLAQ